MPSNHQNALMNRREMLQLTAKGAMSLLAGSVLAGLAKPAAAAYPLTPTVTEGPFCLDSVQNHLLRSDIRTSSVTGKTAAGYPLELTVNLSELNNDGQLRPLEGAYIDIWHCDANGNYSRETNDGEADLSGEDYLRGYQITNGGGTVKFVTIYPGWYHGRTTHIHARIRVSANGSTSYDQATQFYFDEALTGRIYATANPYVARGAKDTANQDDLIYSGASDQAAVDSVGSAAGSRTLLALADTGGLITAAINLVIAHSEGVAALHCPATPSPFLFGGVIPFI